MLTSNFMLRSLSAITGQQLIFPFYHTIGNRTIPHLSFLYKVKTVSEFENDLECLLRNYQPVSAADLFNKTTRGRRCFHITFDDGFSECYYLIAPILLKYGVPATFFVSPAFIDNADLMFRCKASLILYNLQEKKWQPALVKRLADYMGVKSKTALKHAILDITYQQRHKLDQLAQLANISFEAYLQQRRPYLTTSQLLELANMGFTIGAHSNSHPLFSEIDTQEQIFQISTSLQWIHERIEQPLRLFSFPFTDDGLDLEFFKTMSREVCPPVNLYFGTAGMKNELLPDHFQRIAAERFGGDINCVLFKQYVKFVVKAVLMRNISKR